ncbi:hypothetical protein K3M67_13825 [Sphingobium sp. V4]|uniref:hypothetical protein n=1 Tax=Sphingobium sp. V4 TaxID=3038927 RepID=UPI00255837F9|nr:hypothetical protein [Sphingobium sp. V4]WIW88021.1 hypothetical protein K3M67_13825 [Sphingobium sp. V4]
MLDGHYQTIGILDTRTSVIGRSTPNIIPFVLSGFMTKQANQPDPFVAIQQSLQAREILIGLEKHGTGNDELYYLWLGAIGLGPSHLDLSALLDRLETEGFITTEQTDGYRVIKATRAGLEIAHARSCVDWIARAEPD